MYGLEDIVYTDNNSSEVFKAIYSVIKSDSFMNFNTTTTIIIVFITYLRYIDLALEQ